MFRSRKVSTSPSRTNRRSREPETTTHSSNMTSTMPTEKSQEGQNFAGSITRHKRYGVSPLTQKFGSKRSDQASQSDTETVRYRKFDTSPVRTTVMSRRQESSPSRDTINYGMPSAVRSRGQESSPLRDAANYNMSIVARSRRQDSSPLRDATNFGISRVLRSRRQESSPLRNNIKYGMSRTRKCSPSPSRDIAQSRNRLNLIDSSLGDASVDYLPPSPRLALRARVPFRELTATSGIAQSYRISSLSRDDSSDLEYLTKVREILLGEPIKGKTQQPAEILSHMYLGNQSNAESLRLLRKLGITHVLNCAGYKGPRKNPEENPYEGLDIEYYEFKADDRDGYDISQHFDEAFRFLDNVKRKGGICLVHCALGINRSGATVIGYLMIHSKWSLLKAIEYVKKKRGVVLSNHGFQRQLIRFARQQDLLEPLSSGITPSSNSPSIERKVPMIGAKTHQKYWYEDVDETRVKTSEKNSIELGTGPHSALMYRYEKFMNRDKV